MHQGWCSTKFTSEGFKVHKLLILSILTISKTHYSKTHYLAMCIWGSSLTFLKKTWRRRRTNALQHDKRKWIHNGLAWYSLHSLNGLLKTKEWVVLLHRKAKTVWKGMTLYHFFMVKPPHLLRCKYLKWFYQESPMNLSRKCVRSQINILLWYPSTD